MSSSDPSEDVDDDRDEGGLAIPADAASILLAGPGTGPSREACASLLESNPTRDVLFVTYMGLPTDRLSQVTEESGDVTVLTVGNVPPPPTDEAVTTHHVPAPGDLTRLGIEMGQLLDGGAGGPPAVCFDSLTTTLQFADFPTTFEFLHVLTGRARAAGARLHVHVNPAAHDDHVLAAFTTIFDARIDVDPNPTGGDPDDGATTGDDAGTGDGVTTGDDVTVRTRPGTGDTHRP